ncbi:MAG: DUF4423 domain-containing protein [Bdellovibrio sp.]|nr:DUF4423 domain-containing protein [Bdellovibrio sp.]
MNPTAEKDYRSILKDELETRCSKNAHYSLRAFSRDIGLSPSLVSGILNSRHGLSRKAAEKITTRLGYNAPESQYFCDLVESAHARAKIKRDLAKIRLKKNYPSHRYNHLQMDAFKVISDWYHFAILELTYLEGFKSDPSWIAASLSIQEHLVIQAITRLKRLGLLEESGRKLKATQNFTASPDGTPSQCIRNFHQQVLQKAGAAMTTQDVNERDFSASIMAIKKNKVKEAKAAIKTFRRKFTADISNDDIRDEVYCLAIQFFKLTERTSI